ncbi:hypothetical protein N7536_000575 [Penicillium majusculum]|uniref:Tyrosine specific protein phosphatases domain-containing protein n=1 Tax=Penicillium solitum TaxID=60172 RepID=A0A1V6QDS3_9EURO|nr:uncharacterized protein PENSOL_c079G07288 [Penicillium solitum]KAJ5704886.1 hypothetical protein N7536_000575 [Penicillium majusculum]OQD87358.1 hypothetical protein PENSOL_c079G07288 [Penicillium solitum]
MPDIIQNNFGEVVQGIYRSGFPSLSLYRDHLKGVRAIIKLVEAPYANSIQDFIVANGIQVITFILKPNKGQGGRVSHKDMDDIMEMLLNAENHPALIHCNQGKNRTKCVVACFRKLQGWEHSAIIDEYRLYVGHKARPLDEEFIRLYEPGAIS